MLYVFLDFLTMHGLSYLFYRILNNYEIEKRFLGNLSFNLTRSVICGCLAYYSYLSSFLQIYSLFIFCQIPIIKCSLS